MNTEQYRQILHDAMVGRLKAMQEGLGIISHMLPNGVPQHIANATISTENVENAIKAFKP